MNKIKIFCLGAALVLVSAGVFAGKTKFTTPPNLWAYNGTASDAFEMASGDVDGTNLTEGSTNQVKLSGIHSGYGLYYLTSSNTYAPVSSISF